MKVLKGRYAAKCILLSMAFASAAVARPPAAQPLSARATATIDLTGYWVSVITQDWRFRMVTPGPGEYAGVPLNSAAKQAADAWSPAQDEANHDRCKAYGGATIMRVPSRLHITWADENTLKVEIDNGAQTRLFHFGSDGSNPQSATEDRPLSLQGSSSADWEDHSLKVITRYMQPGYVRSNGIPYSNKAELTEYWDSYQEEDGTERLVIMSLLRDPVYLQAPYGFSPIFKREADGSKFKPRPC